ncbi:MAG: hypothetical protein EOP06_12890 [Proteobacteria bacterium]|nr:MAG: hypothetical protein EOP06_12890 [Pseudomonadota bacterium]
MNKPDFDVALAYWENLLQERGFSPNIKWVFRENIFNATSESSGSFKLIFQTKIHPVTLDDVRLVYNQTKSNKGPIVFWMLVEAQDFTLCSLLGDTLSTSRDIYVDEWNLYFFTEKLYLSFEEVTSTVVWANAKRHDCHHISELDYMFSLKWFKKSSN